MKFLGVSIIVIMLLLPLGQAALAITSDFTVRTQISSDGAPPTTPAMITVDPVAPTQINITWSASTDDVLVSGYRLFRDAVQIATTTLLTFNDTGLTPSTTYSYYVDAFDMFNNYSSSSPVVVTTTPVLPPPIATSTSTTTANTSEATRILSMQNLVVTPKETAAVFTWQTNTQTQYSLSWGRTTTYELGTVSGTIFNKIHSTSIDMLEPGTMYFYQLTAIDTRGVARIIAKSTFTTLNKIFTENIPNVEGFSAIANETDVNLIWRNTFTDPNLKVRIVRSHLFYPSTIQEGAAIYEGRGQSFVDKEALLYRSPQYYTIFVIGLGGKVSSGAIARVYLAPANLTGTDGEGEIVETPIVPDTEVIPPTIIDEGDPAILLARDITIKQRDATYTLDTVISLDHNVPYVIRIPFDAVAPNLKTITVSIQNPSNQREVSAYLLKINPAGDAYEASIAQPGVVGSSRILVEVFDYEQQTVRRISTSVHFVNTTIPIPLFPDQILNYLTMIIPWLLLVVFGWVLFIIFKRRRKVEIGEQ